MKKGRKSLINSKMKLEGCPAMKKKRKRAGIYTLILFFAIFVEPYASKGACTALKGYKFYPNQPTLSRKITFFRPRG